MKKKQARKLKSGDKLVMVRDGSYNAAFKSGDKVSFARNKNSQMINVLGLWEGSEIDQTISRKDVELYTEPNETPAQPERPHEALRATYKAGQEWEFKKIGETCAFMSMRGSEPEWLASFEYRLKPEPLDAAPELYCVVFGDDNRMCSLDLSVTITAGTLDQCNGTAELMRKNFTGSAYRVMRLTPA